MAFGVDYTCVLDVQQAVFCNDMRFLCAADFVAYHSSRTPRCTPRCTPCCMRFQCFFSLFTLFLTCVLKNAGSAACSRMLRSYSVQRDVALLGLLQFLLHSV
jgi:hypothetical protein